MRFISRIFSTLRLVRFSLFPVVTAAFPVVSRNLSGSTPIVSPEFLYSCLRNSRGNTESAGEFSLFVPGVYPLSAVFVLFRLKRWGFSACQVHAERGGLRIQGRR